MTWNDDTVAVADWLCRDYKTWQHWIVRGRMIHLYHQISAMTRHILAGIIEEHIAAQLGPAVVNRWVNNEIVETEMQSPRVTDAQWDVLADYVLLGARVEWPELRAENMRRKKLRLPEIKPYA